MVVSEIARSQGKDRATHTAAGVGALALALSLTLGAPGLVQAAGATYDNLTIGKTNGLSVTIANGIINSYNSAGQRRAALGVDNQGNGTLYLINSDLSQAHLYTQSSTEVGNDGITRLFYTSSTEGSGGEMTGVHTIAVLEDGITYQADNYTDSTKTTKMAVKHQLNSTMDVTGGADTSNLSDNNIGVVATAAVEDADGNVTQNSKLEIKLAKDLTGLNSVTTGNTKMNSDGLTITGGPSVTANGIDAGSNTITSVAEGVNGTDAVNVNQLNRAQQAAEQNAKNYTDSQISTVNTKIDTQISNVSNKVEHVAKQHTTVSVNNGTTSGNLVMNATAATDEAGANYDISLAKDVTGLNSVQTNTLDATTVNAFTVNSTIVNSSTVNADAVNSSRFSVAGDGNHSAISIAQGNVAMGGNTVTGVADGKVSADSREAVNGSQLYARDQAIGKLGSSVNRLDNKINRAGAGAAALAALHPQDFDPDDKWDFAAGYGNYHGANAAAIGAFYRPTEDIMVSIGGSTGGGENMINAGVSFKLGQHNHVSRSRVAMGKEILDLRATVAKQDVQIQKLTQLVNQLVNKANA